MSVARATARMLAMLGYRVVGVAHCPEQALESIPQLRPDAVVLDLDLRAQQDGIDVATELARRATIPVLFLTGHSEPPLERLAGLPGVFGYLAKPVNDTALRASLELILLQDHTRQRLTELEHHYWALFDHAAVGMAQLEGGSGRLIDVNRRAAAIFAMTPESLVGVELFELAEPDQRESLRNAFRQLARGELRELDAQIHCRCGDGRLARVRLTATPMSAGPGAVDHVVIIQDVTEWWCAEQQLEHNRSLLARSQRMAAIGSFRLEYATRTLTWTDEMYRIHGVSPDFQPTTENYLPLVHTEDRDRVFHVMLPPTTEAPLRTQMDYRIIRPDGTMRVLRGHGELERDAHGQPVAAVGTLQDVTEQATALSASQAKTDFLAHMSHELRTPLNAVLGLSEALTERVFGPLSDEQSSTVATIHDSGRHLLALINDVLDIARVESGNLPIEPEQVLLRPLIEESAALVSRQLTERSQRLLVELPPAVPPLDVDKRRLKQVLLNLLGNASKFSPSETSITLRVEARFEAREILIEVSDQGPGIAIEERERVFEPFVTLDPSMSRAHGGAGLGLALARRLIELHGGRIDVDDAPGGGSRFRVRLPMAAAYAGELLPLPAMDRDAPAPAVGRPVLLLAEDSEATVRAVRPYLERLGYEVRVATDGISAIEAALDPAVAAVLMDVQLPGLSGVEATRRLRAHRAAAAKPIIALTAHAMPGDEEHCLAAGASMYLPKPVPLRQLADTIARLLETRA